MTGLRIAVIGAGIAGLTAAYRLQQAGARVTVYEARDCVGGRMTSLAWEGFTINPGAQFFTGVDRYLLQMVGDLCQAFGTRDHANNARETKKERAPTDPGNYLPGAAQLIGPALQANRGLPFSAARAWSNPTSARPSRLRR